MPLHSPTHRRRARRRVAGTALIAAVVAAGPASAVAGTDETVHANGLTGPAAAVLGADPTTPADPVRVVAQTVDANGRPDWTVFEADTRAEALAAVKAARAVPDVELVAVDQPVYALSASRYGDTRRTEQWALDDLQAEAAAAVNPGSGVTVAVIDSGVRADHEDFAPGSVLPGRNYLADGRGPFGTVDPNGHGTHVAGIIAAARDNSAGVAGLSGATILPLRVLDAAGGGSSATAAPAIRDAVDLGAQVINLSLGGSEDPFMTAAVTYARGRGVVVVASAGNERHDGNPVSYPAAVPGVVAVAATTPSGTTADFSNTGAYVDIAAPGAES